MLGVNAILGCFTTEFDNFLTWQRGWETPGLQRTYAVEAQEQYGHQ